MPGTLVWLSSLPIMVFRLFFQIALPPEVRSAYAHKNLTQEGLNNPIEQMMWMEYWAGSLSKVGLTSQKLPYLAGLMAAALS